MTIKVKNKDQPAPVPASAAQITEMQSDLGIVTSSGVQTIIEANSNLGALATPVQTLIDTAIGVYNPSVQAKIDASLGSATMTSIDSFTFTTIQAAITYLRSLITGATPIPSAPVPNAVPTISFTGGTGDVGETATIGAGTYTGTVPTSVSWNIFVNGVFTSNTTTINFVIPVSAGTSPRSLQITEIYNWSGGSGTGKSSIVYTINAPAAVPAPSGTLGPIVITSNIATCPHALWTNSPTAYTQKCYNNLGVVLGTASGAGAAGLLSLDISNLGGSQIRWGEISSNGSGSATTEIFSAFTTISGGTAPTYVGGIEPGFVYGVFAVNTPIVINFGVAVNSPQGYDVQFYRNGVATTNTGSFGSNVTSFSYTPINLDSGQMLSATIVPRNAAGVGPSILIPAEYINTATSGSSGTISFVDVSPLGSSSAGATVSPTLPAGAITADAVFAFGSINTVSFNYNTPGGWSTNGGNSIIATPEGMSVNSFYKLLGASESTPVFTATGNDYKQMTLLAYRGATRIVNSAVTTNNSSNASGFTVTFPSVTTDAANQIVILCVDLDPLNGSAGPVTVSNLPLNATVRSNVGFEDGNYGQQVILEVPVAVIGATGTFTMTITTDSTATGWIARTTALGV